MKRILLLIVLVMMATSFLKHRAARPRPGRDGEMLKGTFYRLKWDDELDDYRAEDIRKPRRNKRAKAQHLVTIGPNGKVVEAEQAEPRSTSPVDPPTRKISSQMMATEERAKANAVQKLEQTLSEWLEPEIPTDWKPPTPLVRSMIREVTYTPVVKDYGTLYVAELSADTSSRRREAIIAEYRDEMVHHRMLALGGSLAFVLVCLGIISGYIRADEATKGYYTNRLRMLAAAGAGAAGLAVYRFI